jgi:hypothetical protein
MPPESFHWAGERVINRALVRREMTEDTGKNPGVLVSAVAGLPRRRGWRFPRGTRTDQTAAAAWAGRCAHLASLQVP